MDHNDDVNRKKEVGKEENTEEISMAALLEQSDISLDMPRQGDVREGVIASVSQDEVLVSIGAKSEGVIPGRELSQLTEEQRSALQVGETIKVLVVSPETRQGTVVLSLSRAMEEDDWTQAEELLNSKDVFEGEVSGYNKGGLIVNMGHLRGFVPASQVSMSRRMSYAGDTPEQRWSGMVGEAMVVRIIEVDRQRRRLIMSEKAAAQESRESMKDRLLDELQEGSIRKGRVTSLADFGAFVNINGADGLVHLSEISWERIEHPNEVLKVGEEVDVKVISIDRDRRRIGLSIRRTLEDPWEEYVKDFQVGQLVEGTITRLTKFGAFARINENLEGLIHVSELSDKRIEHPKEVVSEDDVITLRVIKIDVDKRRIGLSLRKVESMKYSDLDWEMTLADLEDIEGVSMVEDQEAEPAESAEEVQPEVEASVEVEETENEPEIEAPEAEP
ncbi:MAG: S1 RNA-binding domain-containing protein, partial [Anaerolineae bacterium]|nr:S1 RNA-binding domain-containing protein [Anaerolineae bacterium]